MVLYKYINCTVDKTTSTGTGHTDYIIYNIYYGMIITIYY